MEKDKKTKDGLVEPTVNDSDEEVFVYKKDTKTGLKIVEKNKSYTLSKVPERIGAKVNTKSRYYEKEAIEFYENNKRVL